MAAFASPCLPKPEISVFQESKLGRRNASNTRAADDCVAHGRIGVDSASDEVAVNLLAVPDQRELQLVRWRM
jgi:hypothetical protein